MDEVVSAERIVFVPFPNGKAESDYAGATGTTHPHCFRQSADLTSEIWTELFKAIWCFWCLPCEDWIFTFPARFISLTEKY